MALQRCAIVIFGVLLQKRVPYAHGLTPILVDRPASSTDLNIQLLQYDSSGSTCLGDPAHVTNITSFTISDTSSVRTVFAAAICDGVDQKMKFEVVCSRDNITNGSVVLQSFICDDQRGDSCRYSNEMRLTNTVEFSHDTCERFTSDNNNTNSGGYLYMSGGLFNVNDFIFGCPKPDQSSTHTTPEPTTTDNGFLQSSFEVIEGGEYCKVVLEYGDCVQDYAQYHNRESCTISMKQSGYISSDIFRTEPGYDFVTINGVGYSGTDGPDNVFVSLGEQILWESDNTTTDLGWRLCFATTAHKPATTATDMTHTWMIVIGVVFAALMVVMALVLRSRSSATKKLEDYTELENWQAVHGAVDDEPESPSQPYTQLNRQHSFQGQSTKLPTVTEEYEPLESHHHTLNLTDVLATTTPTTTTTTTPRFCTMCGLAMLSGHPCHSCRTKKCSVNAPMENDFFESCPRRNSLYE
eukprot:m.48919 g.48919  ORF g.48919 m.48919 type:complete len:467 (-) comp20889_c0_seq1:107-1507(-)